MGKLLAIILAAIVFFLLIVISLYINENIVDIGATTTVKEFMNGNGFLVALVLAIGFYFISKLFR